VDRNFKIEQRLTDIPKGQFNAVAIAIRHRLKRDGVPRFRAKIAARDDPNRGT
jgi:hypothetical protein